MSAERVEIDATLHRPSGTAVVTVRGRVFDTGNGEREGDGGLIGTVVPLAERADVKQVVIDLRAVKAVADTALRSLAALTARLEDSGRRLIVVAYPQVARGVRTAMAAAGLGRAPDLVSDPAALRAQYRLDFDLPDPDEPPAFTADELREMEAEGLTLGAAIRALETRPE